MSNQRKKYYAIKYTANGNKENIIVESWEECSKLVSGYSSIYKSFHTKDEADEYLESFTEKKKKEELIKKKDFSKKRAKKKFRFKPLEYKNKQEKELLGSGYYLDYKFYIISMGLFPIAIISISYNSKLYKKDLDYFNIKLKLNNEISIAREGNENDTWLIRLGLCSFWRFHRRRTFISYRISK